MRLNERIAYSTMAEPLVARISALIAGHRELSISPDVLTSGRPARGLLLSVPSLGDIRRLIRSLRLSAAVWGRYLYERSDRTSEAWLRDRTNIVIEPAELKT